MYNQPLSPSARSTARTSPRIRKSGTSASRYRRQCREAMVRNARRGIRPFGADSDQGDSVQGRIGTSHAPAMKTSTNTIRRRGMLPLSPSGREALEQEMIELSRRFNRNGGKGGADCDRCGLLADRMTKGDLRMPNFICTTCGTQHAESSESVRGAVCAGDPRQNEMSECDLDSSVADWVIEHPLHFRR